MKKKNNNKNDAEGTTEYRTVNQQIKKGMKKAKEDCTGEQPEEKQQQKGISSGQRPDQHKARKNHNHTG